MRFHPLFASLLLALASAPAAGEALRYSGTLMDDGIPAEGAYALRMSLYDASSAGHRVGKAITLVDVPVTSGRFSTELEFGIPPQLLETLWMQVEVAGPEGVFEPLGDRESLDAKALATAACWSTEGNAGLQFSTNFLGTTDPVPLVLKTNNERAMQFIPFFGGLSIVAGYSGNEASGIGATISGGGLAPTSVDFTGPAANRVLDSFGTVGGGYDNEAGFAFPMQPTAENDAHSATVAGGAHNQANATYAAIAGGDSNIATGVASTIGGGRFNETSGPISSVAGGVGNIASGANAAIPGGTSNLAGGGNSFAAGNRAKVRVGDDGTFVWADNQAADFTSTGDNQFLVRASGGAAINGAPPSSAIEFSVYGNPPNGGFVEFGLTPDPLVNANGETIELGAGVGGAGSNDANFRIAKRNGVAGGSLFTQVLTIDSNGITNVVNGAVGNVSDRRLKKNIRGIERPLDTLLELRGHVFEYVDPAKAMNAPGPRMGFVAQEVAQTLPNWVTSRDDGYLQVSTIGFEALAVEAIRELSEENVLLRDELTDLRAQVDRLSARIEEQGR